MRHKRGDHGLIYTEFRHNAKAAINKLLRTKAGEAVSALHHPEVGDIDLIWGKDTGKRNTSYGLAKLVHYHPEVVGHLQDILNTLKKTKQSENSIQLESESHKAVVKLSWLGKEKHWLLTAYEVKKPPIIEKTIDALEAPIGEVERQSLQPKGGFNKNSIAKKSFNVNLKITFEDE